jgi:hypothetical protein
MRCKNLRNFQLVLKTTLAAHLRFQVELLVGPNVGLARGSDVSKLLNGQGLHTHKQQIEGKGPISLWLYTFEEIEHPSTCESPV